MAAPIEFCREQVPLNLRAELVLVAECLFWWGKTEEWLEDLLRLVAQVMTCGDLDDVRLTLNLLGDRAFLDVPAQILSLASPSVARPKTLTMPGFLPRIPKVSDRVPII